MRISLKSTSIGAKTPNILDSDQVRFKTNGVTIDADTVSAAVYASDAVFNGVGAATSDGTITVDASGYTPTVNNVYTIQITAACTGAGTITGAKFKVKKNGGALGAEVAATGLAQDLADGVKVTFAVEAAQNFVVGEQFEILVYAASADKRLPMGTVLGQVTATGLFGPYDPSASDGREVPAYILYPDDAVLIDGDGAYGAIDHARVIKSRLPMWPTPNVIKALPNITFAD